MEIGNWSATAELNVIYQQIRDMGLETSLTELEAFGFTTIEGALSSQQVEYARNAIGTVISILSLN
ncbi:MAG: hypothetical protein IIC60_08355 [Proteobacteria bacterium]|nr:hypothetical protein [Pseudomonadota bacterium]